MSDLESTFYADVLQYQKKAASMVSTLPSTLTGLEGDQGLPPYEVGVNDAIVRNPTVLGGLSMFPYVEYQIALTRRSDNKTATIGKRYSELYYFNHELHRRDIIRKLDAPCFPEKKVFSDEWWKMQTLEPDGKFVRERREEIHYYLKKLFIANPHIFCDSFVQDFFQLATFDHRADTEAYLKSIPGQTYTPAGSLGNPALTSPTRMYHPDGSPSRRYTPAGYSAPNSGNMVDV